MIIGTLLLKSLAWIGAMTIADKVIVPALEVAGKQIGKGIGMLANKFETKAEYTSSKSEG